MGPLGTITGPADMAAVFGIWATLLVAMADKAGREIDATAAKEIASAIGAMSVSYYVGCKVATWAIMLVPFLGLPGAIGISSAANLLFTYRFGVIVSVLFDENAIVGTT
ncbi:MAG: hypothetical protein LBU32_23520 [Clostridiales bacterium]|nr:hypothetical protein [Clostridiales bacterium]